jgi:hypothetical protein
MSWATRTASSSLLRAGTWVILHASFLKPPALGGDARHAHDAADEDAGRHDGLGVERPSSTISCTVAIVHLAAVAMTGPKLRAALR